MSFKFKTRERVNVPGAKCQGVVTQYQETVPGFPVYTLAWVSDDGEEVLRGHVGESDLAAANDKLRDKGRACGGVR